jgi:hypothetical protein
LKDSLIGYFAKTLFGTAPAPQFLGAGAGGYTYGFGCLDESSCFNFVAKLKVQTTLFGLQT